MVLVPSISISGSNLYTSILSMGHSKSAAIISPGPPINTLPFKAIADKSTLPIFLSFNTISKLSSVTALLLHI